MRIVNAGLVSMALLAPVLTVGCGGGGTGVTAADSCFVIENVAPGFSDGCMLQVGETYGPDPTDATKIVGTIGLALLVHHDVMTGAFSVGTLGALGSGVVMGNQGTLTRENNPTLSVNTSCTWHQKDTSMVTLMGTDAFDIAVTEVEDMFSSACPATVVPAGGSCTSTWTWNMQKSTSQAALTNDTPCR